MTDTAAGYPLPRSYGTALETAHELARRRTCSESLLNNFAMLQNSNVMIMGGQLTEVHYHGRWGE